MTLPSEEVRATTMARELLFDLINPKATPRVPKAVRERASRILKHYPMEYHIKARYGNDVCVRCGCDLQWCRCEEVA